MTMSDGLHPVVVNVGACRCSGTADAHPAGDEVYLAPEASMLMGLRANGALAKADNDPEIMETLLGKVFIEEGVIGWTFVEEAINDRTGKLEILPVPVTYTNIARLLTWANGGALVSEKANDIYSEAILAPLRRRSSPPRQPGPIDKPTSPIPPSPSTPRKSSKSSSPVPSETTS